MRAGLYGAEVGRAVAGRAADRFQEHLDSVAGLDAEEQMLHQDLRMYLPDDILTKVDRMSMAVSLETRVPLLDHRIVEFAATVPFRFKYNKGVSKRLVKHALRGLVPEELLKQRKRGFAVPIHRWFRGPLREHYRETVLSGDALNQDFLDSDLTGRIFEDHVDRREDYGHHLWTVLMFEHWLRYMDGHPNVNVSV